MPEDWKIYTFEELYNVTSGLSKSRDQFGFGSPFVTFKNVFYNYFLPVELDEFANTNEREQKSCSVKRGDIFLTRTSETLHELGMSSVALKDYPKATFNGFCKRLRLKENLEIKIDPVFIGYYLRTATFRNEVTKHATMTTRASLNTSSINSLTVALPSYKEQIKIGEILKPLDDKIELNLQQNKTLEEMAMALYKHWVVDFGPFQNGEFVESELGLIPSGWEVKSIGDIAKITGGYAFKSKDFSSDGEKVVKIKNISNNVVIIEGSDCIPISVAEKTNSKFSILPGNYLVAMTGAEVGKVGIVPDYKERLWLNQRVGMVSEPNFKFADILVGNYFQSKECYDIIQNLAYGSAQPNISSSDLEGITIVLPKDTTILNQFLEKLKNWDELKVANYSENQTLTTLRDTLLPKLISGEVRVKEAQQILSSVL